MSSTVTVSTVSTVSNVAIFTSLGVVVVVLLLLLLIKKEILTSSTRPVAITLTKILNLVIVPLLMAFGMIAIVNVIRVLH